jgi:signal transduction histidine kinase
MKLSIRTKLAALLVIAAVVPAGVTLWLSLGTLSRVADYSARKAGEALAAQARGDLLTSVRELARETDLILERANDNAGALSAYAASLYSYPALFGGPDYWNAASRLRPGPEGGWTAAQNDNAAVFVPPRISLTAAVYRDLNIASRLDFLMRGLHGDDPRHGLSYVILANGSLARAFPPSGVTASPDFDGRLSVPFAAVSPGDNPQRETVWTRPHEDSIAGRGWVVTAAGPIYTTGGQFIGAVGVDVSLRNLHDTMETVSAAHGGYALLADPSGAVIMATARTLSDLGLTGDESGGLSRPAQTSLLSTTQPAFRQAVPAMLNGRAGAREVGQGKESRLVAWAPVPSTNWILVLLEPKAEVVLPVAEIRKAVVEARQVFLVQVRGMGVFVGLVALILAIAMGAAFTRPLEKLSEGARAIAHGDLTHRLRIRTGDEVQELSEEFNVMADRIQEISADLERRVADRTIEMAALYAAAAATSRFLNLSSIMHEALEQVTKVTGWESGEIYIFAGQVGNAPDRFTSALPPLVADAIRSLAVSGYGDVAAAGAEFSYYLISVERDLGLPAGAVGLGWPVDVAIFPVRSKGQSLGYLALATAREGHHGTLRPALVNSIAGQLAVAIENFQLYEQARQLAAGEERSRLARELHDSVSQTLFGIALTAEAAATLQATDPVRAAEQLARLSALTAAAQNEMRDLIFALRPEALQNEGLLPALRRFMTTVRTFGLEAVFEVEGEPDIGSEREYALYHFIREAAHNVVKHAKARRVMVSLAFRGDRVWAEVFDDGIGFALGQDGWASPRPGGAERQAARGLGLSTMRERALVLNADLVIETAPGAGTRLCLVPVGAPDDVRRGE